MRLRSDFNSTMVRLKACKLGDKSGLCKAVVGGAAGVVIVYWGWCVGAGGSTMWGKVLVASGLAGFEVVFCGRSCLLVRGAGWGRRGSVGSWWCMVG